MELQPHTVNNRDEERVQKELVAKKKTKESSHVHCYILIALSREDKKEKKVRSIKYVLSVFLKSLIRNASSMFNICLVHKLVHRPVALRN